MNELVVHIKEFMQRTESDASGLVDFKTQLDWTDRLGMLGMRIEDWILPMASQPLSLGSPSRLPSLSTFAQLLSSIRHTIPLLVKQPEEVLTGLDIARQAGQNEPPYVHCDISYRYR